MNCKLPILAQALRPCKVLRMEQRWARCIGATIPTSNATQAHSRWKTHSRRGRYAVVRQGRLGVPLSLEEVVMRRFLLASIGCLLAISPVGADERYLVVLFAVQSPDGAVRRSHTFATFMKVDVGEPDEDGEIPTEALETVTISWLPASGELRVLARPEQGRNFDLQETLRWAKDNDLTTTMRGPFEIGK